MTTAECSPNPLCFVYALGELLIVERSRTSVAAAATTAQQTAAAVKQVTAGKQVVIKDVGRSGLETRASCSGSCSRRRRRPMPVVRTKRVHVRRGPVASVRCTPSVGTCTVRLVIILLHYIILFFYVRVSHLYANGRTTIFSVSVPVGIVRCFFFF